jgi:exopolysaccharide biosynthesis polyprenyl glycosylphosphotransferase
MADESAAVVRPLEAAQPRIAEVESPRAIEDALWFAPRAVRRRRVGLALLACDTAMLLLALLVATLLRFGGFGAVVSSAWGSTGPAYVELSLALAAALLIFMSTARLYDLDHLGWGSGEFNRVVQALAMGFVAVIVVMYVVGLPYLSREWAGLAWGFGAVFVVTGRLLVRFVAGWYRAHNGWLQRPTLIVGSNVEAAEIGRILRANPSAGLVPVGCLSSSLKDRLSFDYCSPVIPLMGSARDLIDVVREREIDTVVIVASAFDYEIMQKMLRELRGAPVTVHISSSLSEVLSSRVLTREVSGIPLISLRGVSLSPLAMGTKRAFDLVIGGAIILAGLPLWLVVAGLIKATSPGPVLYWQQRIGRGGHPFRMYKFRSMVDHADDRLRELTAVNEADGPLFKIHDDPRVTRVGKWIRKFSIDEFPQLLNVMTGDMSLVGPRPPLPRETVHYTEHDWRRLEVPPGMTGLWQVSGRSRLTFREMIRLDVFYIDNWSVSLDVALLMRTLPAVLRARGAY